jgi:hypothetical protein
MALAIGGNAGGKCSDSGQESLIRASIQPAIPTALDSSMSPLLLAVGKQPFSRPRILCSLFKYLLVAILFCAVFDKR